MPALIGVFLLLRSVFLDKIIILLLTKCEAKVAGYCLRYFFLFLWAETKSR